MANQVGNTKESGRSREPLTPLQRANFEILIQRIKAKKVLKMQAHTYQTHVSVRGQDMSCKSCENFMNKNIQKSEKEYIISC